MLDDAPVAERDGTVDVKAELAIGRRRDYTVDWVHLKVNDQAQSTVLCKDPFAATDERVDRLMEQL